MASGTTVSHHDVEVVKVIFARALNGSPLFTGNAGSGESEIRRYVLENDLVEAIIGLPTDMFCNTGISTYIWILTNRKPEHRRGKVQLIDASGMWQKMRQSLGSKRKELSEDHIAQITKLFGECQEGWGASVIPRLAVNLKNELPEEKGFSPRNLGNMVRFFREYGVPTNLQHTAAKLGSPEVAGDIERASASSLPSIEDNEAELSQDLAEDES